MRKLIASILAIALLVLAITSTSGLAYAPAASATTKYVDHFTPYNIPVKLDQKPELIGGVPFCKSGTHTIFCYPPRFLANAYNFPAGLDGTYSTIVIVDAFGSPTLLSDISLFDSTYGVPAISIKFLCPPTFTGAASDVCPDTIASNFFAPLNPLGALCGGLGWAEETTLDVAMAHSLAPGAKIVVVEAASCYDTDLYGAEQAVVSQPSLWGSVMTQSFGEAEDTVPPSIFAQWESIYNTATANEWTILASSADDGANTNLRQSGTTELTPSWPATSPLVLAIGGTQGYPFHGDYGTSNPANPLNQPAPPTAVVCAAGGTLCNTGLEVIQGVNGCAGPTLRPASITGCSPYSYGGEGAWNEATNPLYGAPPSVGRSTGGGVSQLYSRPAYQVGLSNTWATTLGGSISALNKRLNPDVSFNAATDGGIPVPFSPVCSSNSNPNCPAWLVFGGTSASSPAWAAIIAILNEAAGGPIGFINPAIYNIGRTPALYSAAFHDIIHGNNSDTAGLFGVDGFNAAPGYDLTTGWGTPNVNGLLTTLLGPYPLWEITVNLRLLSYKVVNVNVQVCLTPYLTTTTICTTHVVTLSHGSPVGSTVFYTQFTSWPKTVKISGYSIATQTQIIGGARNSVVNFNIT